MKNEPKKINRFEESIMPNRKYLYEQKKYVYDCPFCDSTVEESLKRPNYCNNCGQKLDWGPVEHE